MDGPVPGLQGRRPLTVATHPMTDPARTLSPEPEPESAILKFTNATTPRILIASTLPEQRTDNRTVARTTIRSCVNPRPRGRG
ncbi:hypothetical protein GCM10018966_033030 [Streptomyces yanii]